MEKCGVEVYNDPIRQHFPKRHDFATITPERLQKVEEEINRRPRNILANQFQAIASYASVIARLDEVFEHAERCEKERHTK
jgi:IS30 family transposase